MAEETKTNEPVVTEQPKIEIKQETPAEEKNPQKHKKVISEKQKEALKKGRERRWKKEVSVKVQSEVETQLSSSESEEELPSPPPSPPKLKKEKKFLEKKKRPTPKEPELSESEISVSDVSSVSSYECAPEESDSQEDNVPEESDTDSDPEPDTQTRHRREPKKHVKQMKPKKKTAKRQRIERDVDKYLMSFMPMFL